MVTIMDLFSDHYMTEVSAGFFKMECPDCGLQGDRTLGFILFPNSNSAFCHETNKKFNMLEAYALKKKIITCKEGNDRGEYNIILDANMYKQTLQELEAEYGSHIKNQVIKEMGKKKIELPKEGRLISEFAKDIVKELKPKEALFYRQESRDIVEIGEVLHKKDDKEEIYYTGFLPIDENKLVTKIEKYITPGVYFYPKNNNKKTIGKFFARKSMTSSMSKILLKSHIFQRLPNIQTIFTVPLPIIHKGKLTFPIKGYDPRFNSWLDHNCPDIIKPDMELEESKNIIYSIYKEFCFRSHQDYINAVSDLLTPFCRGIMGFTTRTPVTGFVANRERAGKDYCAGCTGMLYEGKNIEDTPIVTGEKYTNTNDELRKKITAAMMHGRKRMHFANNKGHLDNSVFEAVVTQETYTDRKLGGNTMVVFDNEMDFSISTNAGMTATADMNNRMRFVNLSYDEENANERKFENPDLHGWILKNRSLILSALYALVRNWVEKGCPKGSLPFTSFPKWAEVVGGIMEAGGYNSPCAQDGENNSLVEDNETRDMKILYEVCYHDHPDKMIPQPKLIEIMIEEELFDEIDLNDRSGKMKIGKILKKFANRILSDIRMIPKNESLKGARQEYKFTKQKIIKKSKEEIFGEKKQDLLTLRSNLPFSTPSLKNNNKKLSIEMIEKGTKVHKVHKYGINSQNIQQKPKSDREIQFWDKDCVETRDIVRKCKREQAYEWIKQNPGVSWEKFDDELPFGALYWIVKFTEEGIIKEVNDGWELIEKEVLNNGKTRI